MTEGHTSEKPGCFLLPRLLRNDRPALSFERCRSRKRERLMPGSHPSEQALSDQHRQAPAVCGNWLAISYDLPTQLFITTCPTVRLFLEEGEIFHDAWGPFFRRAFSTVRRCRKTPKRRLTLCASSSTFRLSY